LVAVAIIVAVIVYGSLYPFTFRQPEGGTGPLRNLLQSWADTPHRGDFVANVFFYLPLGFFGSLASAGRGRVIPRIMLVALAGAALSVAMELAQYYLAERVSAADDVYANLTGMILGAIAGNLAGGDLFMLSSRQIAAERVPCLLLALWLGYRLYPYIPTIDLHKYWQAVRPVILFPRPSGYDLFRYSAMWLAVGSLIEEVGGPRRGRLLFPAFIVIVLVAKVVIVGKALSAAEIAGAASAVAGCAMLAIISSERSRVTATALIFAASVIAERLAPFHLTPYGREFTWLPFHSFLHGSLELNVISFLEKAFLYGALIWLSHRSGLRLATSTGLVAATLFLTSWAETFLPGRSAEITDALMALLIGAIIAVVKTPTADSRKTIVEVKRSA
jgi:VanZ family protein